MTETLDARRIHVHPPLAELWLQEALEGRWFTFHNSGADGATTLPLPAFTVIKATSEDENSDATNHFDVATTGEVTVKVAGVYNVCFTISPLKTTSSVWSHVDALIFKDSGGGFAAITHANVHVMLGNSGIANNGHWSGIVTLAAGDILRVEARIIEGLNIDIPVLGYTLEIQLIRGSDA